MYGAMCFTNTNPYKIMEVAGIFMLHFQSLLFKISVPNHNVRHGKRETNW
jgi:hypothetical protein